MDIKSWHGYSLKLSFVVLKNEPINAILISIYVALYSPNYDLQGKMAL
jgi:hypothetical protein